MAKVEQAEGQERRETDSVEETHREDPAVGRAREFPREFHCETIARTDRVFPRRRRRRPSADARKIGCTNPGAEAAG